LNFVILIFYVYDYYKNNTDPIHKNCMSREIGLYLLKLRRFNILQHYGDELNYNRLKDSLVHPS